MSSEKVAASSLRVAGPVQSLRLREAKGIESWGSAAAHAASTPVSCTLTSSSLELEIRLDKEAERPRKAEAGTGKSNPLRGGSTLSTPAAAGCVCAREMSPRDGATWLPSALFLLQVSGEWGWAGQGACL